MESCSELRGISSGYLIEAGRFKKSLTYSGVIDGNSVIFCYDSQCIKTLTWSQ